MSKPELGGSLIFARVGRVCLSLLVAVWSIRRRLLLRATKLHRTYGTHKKLYISLFSLDNIWSYMTMVPRNSMQGHHILTQTVGTEGAPRPPSTA